ncbi:chemotaxis protein CheD [Mediterraneibacter sp. NSJ-55]|uniref:Probable chemoreceptor glutamine deamidase CheD n=1 Tax=Mediterraneibacter hominis TaxID=2763054 RepID=A0A923LJF9_9FIRM|nr:chemotaxis protein CheD [Mediterraneibacter hominis]MBC5689359.1 chemotaxis protein CheD [Mediterraneibacter hominis]
MRTEIKIGIGDMKVLRQEGILITYALGSCIGVTLYDPMIKLGGLLHIMLPQATDQAGASPFKFADTGVREMVRKMAVFGGSKNRYICKIAGGAQMFKMTGPIGNIGERNILSVKKALSDEQIRIQGEDIGKNYARTMLLDVGTGEVKIRTMGRQEIIL